MKSLLVFGLGFIAQMLFFARTFLQWLKSENEGEIISPVVFWKISLVASILMLCYGIFRNDFVIILGQLIVYFIYIRNLQFKNAWENIPVLLKLTLIAAPFALMSWHISLNSQNLKSIIWNPEIKLWLLLLGMFGQIIFTFRFVYQWLYSEKEKESLLPATFWIFSAAGSLIILIYAIFRYDPVLFLSNLFGLFIYIRNLLIGVGKTGLFSGSRLSIFQELTQKISDRIR
jgi:lipid-A-disaccharide synthase-like uncharacterized protein